MSRTQVGPERQGESRERWIATILEHQVSPSKEGPRCSLSRWPRGGCRSPARTRGRWRACSHPERCWRLAVAVVALEDEARCAVALAVLAPTGPGYRRTCHSSAALRKTPATLKPLERRCKPPGIWGGSLKTNGCSHTTLPTQTPSRLCMTSDIQMFTNGSARTESTLTYRTPRKLNWHMPPTR